MPPKVTVVDTDTLEESQDIPIVIVPPIMKMGAKNLRFIDRDSRDSTFSQPHLTWTYGDADYAIPASGIISVGLTSEGHCRVESHSKGADGNSIGDSVRILAVEQQTATHIVDSWSRAQDNLYSAQLEAGLREMFNDSTHDLRATVRLCEGHPTKLLTALRNEWKRALLKFKESHSSK